jgi:hypothetical protein
MRCGWIGSVEPRRENGQKVTYFSVNVTFSLYGYFEKPNKVYLIFYVYIILLLRYKLVPFVTFSPAEQAVAFPYQLKAKGWQKPALLL